MPEDTEPVTTPTEPHIVPSTPPPTPPPPPAGMSRLPSTQEELDALVGKLKGETESAVRRKILEQFGERPLEEVQAILAQHDEAVEANKTEHQKAMEALEAERTKLAQQASEAEKVSRRAKLTTALLSVNGERPALRQDRLEAALMMGEQYAISVDSEDPVAAAVEFVHSTSPEWFGPVLGEPTPTQTPSAPRKPANSKPASQDDAAARAKARAAAYRSGARSPMPGPTSRSA